MEIKEAWIIEINMYAARLFSLDDKIEVCHNTLNETTIFINDDLTLEERSIYGKIMERIKFGKV